MDYYFVINILLWIITGSLCKQTSIYTYDVNSIGSQTCGDKSYECNDGSCIPEKYYCNGMVDCEEGEDERNCETCPVDFCPCTDGLCISINDRCNGKTDCIMESEDEQSCTAENILHTALTWNFYTPKRRCIFEGNAEYNMKIDCSNMELVALPCVTICVKNLILNNNKLGLFNGLSNLSFTEYRYKCLDILEIENNHLKSLPPKMFEDKFKLRTLSLAGNQLSHLDGIVFPPHLKKLHLQNNKIKNLPPKIFENLKALIDLSVAGNRIGFLEEEIFSDLCALTVLNLTRNAIKTLNPGIFSGLIVLEILDISHNQIEIITNRTFHRLESLTELHLNSNHVTKLAKNTFQSLKNLWELCLQSNRISVIENNTFNGLDELKTLDLSQNELTQLELEIFGNITGVRMLLLNDNHIVEIQDDTFSNMKNLFKLFIHRNNITKMFRLPPCDSIGCPMWVLNYDENAIKEIDIANITPKQFFIHDLSLQRNEIETLKSGVFNGTEIKTLRLNDNRISTIEDCAFKGLKMDLGGLICLNSNNITKITSRTFEGITNQYMTVKLNDNRITTIEDYTFGTFDFLKLLDLSSNALSKITANMFHGDKKIDSIILQNNQIERIEKYSFNEMKHLEMINLANNRLTKLHSNIFRGSYKLQRLYFQSNKIEYVEKDAFYNLTELLELNLSNNSVTELLSDVFPSLLKLQELHLEINRIENIETTTFRNLTQLITLDLSDNMITELKSYVFGDLFNLETLSIRKNRVKSIETYAFKNLIMLTMLDLSDNEIVSLPSNLLLDAKNLKNLYLQCNKIKIIDESAFSGLAVLSTLNLKNNEIGDLNPNIFNELEKLQYIIVDEFRFCCLKRNIRKCESPKDEFSSCEDLMKNSLLRTFVWILGITSIVANLFVIIFRIRYRSANTNQVNSVLIKNLAMSDLLMGIYLLIIAITDLIYRGEYYIHDKYWRESYWCNLAGFLSTFSSELTVFILTILSADRLYAISFPIRAKQRGIGRTKKLITIVWILAAIIGIVPLSIFNINYFKNFYGRSGVCLSLHITSDTPTGWQYSVFVFIILNAVLFAVIAICYFSMFVITTKARRSITSSNRAAHTAIAFRMTLLVMADAICWIPIITLGIRSLMGTNPSPHVYPWIAVFVLPLNAALNPILYTISSIPIVIRVKFPNTRLNGRLGFRWPFYWIVANKTRKP